MARYPEYSVKVVEDPSSETESSNDDSAWSALEAAQALLPIPDSLTQVSLQFWQNQPTMATQEYEALTKLLTARTHDNSVTLPWEIESERLLRHIQRFHELSAFFSEQIKKTELETEVALMILHDLTQDIEAAAEAFRFNLIAESLQDVTVVIRGHRLTLVEAGLINTMTQDEKTGRVTVHLQLSPEFRYQADLLNPLAELVGSDRLIRETAHLPFEVWFCWPEAKGVEICLANTGEGLSPSQINQLKRLLKHQYEGLFDQDRELHTPHIKRAIWRFSRELSRSSLQNLHSAWRAVEHIPGGVPESLRQEAYQKIHPYFDEYLPKLENFELMVFEIQDTAGVVKTLYELVVEFSFLEELGCNVKPLALATLEALRHNDAAYKYLIKREDGVVINTAMRRLLELKN